jgi:hypothetical protein
MERKLEDDSKIRSEAVTTGPTNEGIVESSARRSELNDSDLDKVSGGAFAPLPPDKRRNIAHSM